jgi:hypothetical protein
MFRTITLFALVFALIVLTLTVLLALRDLLDWADDVPGILAADGGDALGQLS